MERNLILLEFDRLLEIVALGARSEPGRETVRALRPCDSIDECEHAQSLLWEMVRLRASEGGLPLAGLGDVGAAIDARELDVAGSWEIVRSVQATQAVRETVLRSELPLPALRELASEIPTLDDLLRDVGRYFTRDGKLREDASPVLRSLRQRVLSRRATIQKTLSELMSRHSDAVQDNIVTVRGDRYCIPLRTDRRQEVPGILHERSGSGASVFVEPIAIVEANNELTGLLLEEREEIARLVREIATRIARDGEKIRLAIDVAARLDALEAIAHFATTIDGSRPAFSTDRELRLIEARHPLLDQRLAAARRDALGDDSDVSVVPTTLSVSRDVNALVISGPNAGGKTVALKTAGLIAVMAASGLPVPAREGTVVPYFDDVHVLIGDDQSVMAHLSTFSAYLVRLRRILETASERSLVLLDELGSGTDPEEGAALAAAVLEDLAARGALLLVTTHLTALKTFATDNLQVANASMEFDAESGRPTFRLLEGLPGRSRAIEAARIVGIPRSVIESATRRLGEDYGRLDRLVGELQARISEARQRETELSIELERAKRTQHEAEEALRKFEAERREVRTRYGEEVRKLRDDVQTRVHGELRKLREADEASRKRASSAAVAASVVAPVEEEQEDVAGEIAVGDEVEHRRFKLRGTVTAVTDERVQLKSGGKLVEFPRGDFRLVRESASGGGARGERKRQKEVSAPATAELNLVGWRVDEAIEEADRCIDQSLLEGRSSVRIIHGFGTGALRAGLRDWLRTHRGVRAHRPGNEHEGGDGVTIAELDVH